MGSIVMNRAFNRTAVLRLSAAGAALAALAMPVAAQAPSLAMLAGLQKGAWTLRMHDSGAQHRVCVRDGRELIQIQHRQPPCPFVVVSDQPQQITVQYTCRGNGYGRTSIRKEGSGLLQVQSQGIENGTPFSFSAEARYAGRC